MTFALIVLSEKPIVQSKYVIHIQIHRRMSGWGTAFSTWLHAMHIPGGNDLRHAERCEVYSVIVDLKGDRPQGGLKVKSDLTRLFSPKI